MGWKPEQLPDHVRRLIPPAERKLYGKAGMTNAEAQVKADTRAERELQKDMENLLRQRNLFFVRSRMDKKTTTRKGLPDFIIVLPKGRALLVEAKVQGGELSEDQQRVFADYLNQTGEVVHIIFNLPAFSQLLDQYTP